MTAVEPYVTHWADRIRPHLARAVEGIVAAGRELAEAKEALPHGQFGPLLDELGMSARMAQRYMRAAAHPILGDATRVTHLPAAIGTLDALARWDDDDLVAALDAGDIGPATTRAEAEHRQMSTATGQHAEAIRFCCGAPASLADARHEVFGGSLGPALEALASSETERDEIVMAYAESRAIHAAARGLVRTGRLAMPPDYWKPVDGDARAATNRLTEWRLRVEREAGAFLTWCKAAGITIGAQGAHLPERLTWPTEIGERPRWMDDEQDGHEAALGHFGLWWFTPAELAEISR